jgi:cell division control protein 24
MASVAGRKKSLISPASVHIDIPVGTNTLLNKAASQSTSLYQQCSALRSRLLRVHGFAQFFALSSPSGSFRSSAEVVNTVWDCFALGTPLCYLFNLLPGPITPIDIKTDPRSVEVDNERAKKRAIALFAIQVKQLNHGEQFTVTDLWDRTHSDGFVKVVNTVTHLVDLLPPDVFDEAPPPSPPSTNDSFDFVGADSPSIPTPANGPEIERNNIIRELVETERKYVQDLEVMQKYAQELSQSNTLDRDTIHLLFPNLNKLLNFQRRFLIRLEGTADMQWREQRWGILFSENEEEFAVYEPYCANYTNASELMLMEEQNLVKYNHLINAKSELPAFLIKPVQRICKYPLLLHQLLKKSSPIDYPYYDELKAGSAAAKRITDKINEAQRRAENVQTVQNLAARVDDWKGHHVSQFGELLLDDIFIVTKSEVDREYHVFLFERIILCCKEDTSVGSSRKGSKSNSILKKPQANSPSPSGHAGGSKKKMTPLLLKGRIYLNNVTDAKVVQPGSYSLNIWWKGDDDTEFFTLRCRNEEQVKQWESAVKRLIEKVAMRRASERSSSRLAHLSNPSGYNPSRTGSHDRVFSSHPVPVSSHPYANGRPYRQSTPYEDHVVPNGTNGHAGGPSGYPPHGGFDLDDDLDDHSSIVSPTSGRSTPLDGRRGVMTPGFDQYYSYERPRALTEDANGPALSQWRSNVPGLPSGPSPRLPHAHMGPTTSYTSEPGFGHRAGRPQLRTQYSSSRLRPPHDGGESATSPLSALPPLTRSRSASQPSAYVPLSAAPTPVPPLPSNGWDRTQGSTSTTKRSSGSSQSTGDESTTYSPNSLSPITPFGSSDSSLSGTIGRSSTTSYEVPVKVKVYFGTDIFVIQVGRAVDYVELVERVGKKIRLCGPRRDNGPLRVKYEDEEGDLISMRSTEDVEMAFGDKMQVVLHVA